MRGFTLACAVLVVACGGDDETTLTSSNTPASASGVGGASSSGGATGGGGASGGAGGAGAAGGSGGGAPAPTIPYVYVGSSEIGVAVYLLDRATGELTPKSTVRAAGSLSFLATDPAHRLLVATNEGADRVAAFSIDKVTGELTFLNMKSSGGNGPAYVSVDQTGAWALAANYGDGAVAVLPIGADGMLGDAVDVESPGDNAHLVRTDASNAFAFAPCLGSDLVAQFSFDAATGELTPNTPASAATAPGAGPRHLEFHPDLPVVWVINELGDTVDTYALDAAEGTLSPIDTQPTLPPGADGDSNACADLHLSPDRKFLYGSNRGHDSLVVYAVDPTTGKPTVAGHVPTGGSWPRNFGIDPEGDIVLVANQKSGTIVTFRVDHATGLLTQLVTTRTNGDPAWVGVITQPDTGRGP